MRTAVKEITREIYQQFKEMTINAPDWDTYNSAKIAAELAWGTDLSISKYIGVSQSFVEIFSDQGQEIRSVKRSLVKYLGLLHYTGIPHAAIDYLYPLPASTTIPTVSTAALTVLCQLCETFLHPKAIAFLPMFILHLPAYITGWLAARVLTKPKEEETKAQFKAIFGGLGMGLSYTIVIRTVLKVMHGRGENGTRWLAEMLPQFFIKILTALRQRLPENEGLLQKLIGTVVVAVGTISILWKWHNFLVKGNLERWRYLSASVKILVGLVLPPSNDLEEARLVAYSRPPPPAENLLLKQAVVNEQSTNPPPISATKLIRPLIAARLDAVEAVRKLEGVKMDGGRVMGGRTTRAS